MEQTKKVLVLCDFARLSPAEFDHVNREVRKKYPDYMVLPFLDEKEKEFNQQSNKVKYIYFTCYVERSLKNEVKLTYQSTTRRINRVGCYVSLEGVKAL
jgi:hypothetical protein